jgi:hypothetical protein
MYLWGSNLREYLIIMHKYDIVWIPKTEDEEVPF